MNKLVGHIISGSLNDGFIIRIVNSADIENIKTGKFVSIITNNFKFFCLVTDLKLEVTNPTIIQFPPQEHETLLKKVLKNKDVYATATLRPMVTLDQFGNCSSAKTIPAHFSPVYEAQAKDVELIFGKDEVHSRYFNIGYPLDMNIPVCINLENLTERSNGIFGKSGTGKTFLTRVLLAGLIYKDKAVNIIFDMHSEYGLQARQEGNKEAFVKGLKTLFPDKVAIFSLDPDSTRRRGGMPDLELTIPYNSISIEDIISLDTELNLNATAYEAAYLIYSKHKNWLYTLLCQGDRLKDFAQEVGCHPESISSLYRKLKIVERLPFLTQSNDYIDNMIDRMMEYIDRGISIIIEFGNYTSTFCYLLVANIISRRIHKLYIQKTEKFLGTQNKKDEPKKLMITIEEAHKFLNTQSAKQTIFGNIAREMRKYYVSLLIVDQRPSCIDPEVLSQIGTRVIAQLNDEKDIQSALNGVNHASQLRSVLATLETKKQALVAGHAVSMPIVIKTRDYDSQFYKDVQLEAYTKSTDQLIKELF